MYTYSSREKFPGFYPLEYKYISPGSRYDKLEFVTTGFPTPLFEMQTGREIISPSFLRSLAVQSRCNFPGWFFSPRPRSLCSGSPNRSETWKCFFSAIFAIFWLEAGTVQFLKFYLIRTKRKSKPLGCPSSLESRVFSHYNPKHPCYGFLKQGETASISRNLKLSA